MKPQIDSKILDRLKSLINADTDAELARKLRVKPAVISNWRARDTVNLETIITNCEGIDLNLLLTGKRIEEVNQTPGTNFVAAHHSAYTAIPDLTLENARLKAQVEILTQIIITLKKES